MFSTDHLRKLAEEERSDFLRRIAQRVAPDEVQECEDNLRGLVLMAPLLLGRLRQLWNQPNMPSGVRNLSGYLFTYLDHPGDMIAEEEQGLFGYVDDAYLVAAAYLRAVDFLSYTHPLKRGRERELMLTTREFLESARRVIPGEAEKIDSMVEGLLAGNDQSFQQILAAEGV